MDRGAFEMKRVLVAMSGGVDSSVAAALLMEEGHEVSGVTMKVWDEGDVLAGAERHGCYGPGEQDDIEDARAVAQALGIPFRVLDLRREYRAQVLDYFRREYLRGRTPNPCVRCNRWVKLGAMLARAREDGLQFDYFATGHYARVAYDGGSGRYLLKKARDLSKDQSYFLCALSQEQLGRCLFPLGDHTKEEVRDRAHALGLAVRDKPESQDFIGDGDYSAFLGASPGPGPITDSQGNVLGEHRGIPFYTIGQRRGLGIAARQPLYVTAIDPGRNTIVAGPREEVYASELVASELNWIAVESLERPARMKARIRYRHEEAEALVTPLDGGSVHVRFALPQMAVTPGQAVVFYDGDVVVGGGTIERAGPP